MKFPRDLMEQVQIKGSCFTLLKRQLFDKGKHRNGKAKKTCDNSATVKDFINF